MSAIEHQLKKLLRQVMSDEALEQAEVVGFLFGTNENNRKPAIINYKISEDLWERKFGHVYLKSKKNKEVVVFVLNPILVGPDKPLSEYGATWYLELQDQ